jgi:hypothetical protein
VVWIEAGTGHAHFEGPGMADDGGAKRFRGSGGTLVLLPIDATTVAGFLADGPTTVSAGALSHSAPARHRKSGFASLAADAAVKPILRAARRTATSGGRRPSR